MGKKKGINGESEPKKMGVERGGEKGKGFDIGGYLS
jgi:hypothetical protein